MTRAFTPILLAAWMTNASAQPSAQAFEVASVKLNRTGASGPGSSSLEFSPGGERFAATNVGLGVLILTAYDVTSRQISGASFLNDRYDIEAKASQPTSRRQMLHLLQTLLEERFHLILRREIKELPAYALVVRKGGPKLHMSGVSHSNEDAPRNPYHARGAEPRSGHLVFADETMADFAWLLSTLTVIGDRIVVDKTGLDAHYDFELQFGSELAIAPQAGASAGAPVPGAEGPSIFTALQEQLGLSLESRRLRLPFLVVEHVERPAGN